MSTQVGGLGRIVVITGATPAVGVRVAEAGRVLETAESTTYIVPPICDRQYNPKPKLDTQSDVRQAIAFISIRRAGVTAGRRRVLRPCCQGGREGSTT